MDRARRLPELWRGSETSCFLLVPLPDNVTSGPWPFSLYPSGKCEVVFQHMLTRPPFDEAALREEFCARLNAVDGIDLPAGKLEMRPGFPLDVLASEARLSEVLRTLSWFATQAWLHSGQPGNWLSHLEETTSEETDLQRVG